MYYQSYTYSEINDDKFLDREINMLTRGYVLNLELKDISIIFFDSKNQYKNTLFLVIIETKYPSMNEPLFDDSKFKTELREFTERWLFYMIDKYKSKKRKVCSCIPCIPD